MTAKISRLLAASTFAFASLLLSCNSDESSVAAPSTDSLTEEQLRLPENALKGLVVAEGLEVKIMATEPMLKKSHQYGCR